MPAAKDRRDALAGALQRGLLTRGSFATALEGGLKRLELTATLVDLAAQRLDLRLKERSIEGDQHGARHAEDGLLGAQGPDRRQPGFIEPAHLLPRNGQELRMLGGHQGADEVRTRAGNALEVVVRVIALAKNQ